jgi:hypothetical protein
MTPSAKIVHQTRDRLRLRIQEKRRDLPYFLDLYEHLHRAPGVDEVTMNPTTGSVLLRFDDRHRNTVLGVVADSPQFALSSRPAISLSRSGKHTQPGRIEKFLNAQNASATDPRTIVFLIMFALSVRQLLKGQILAPVLTIALYGIDFAAGLKKDTEQPQGPD